MINVVLIDDEEPALGSAAGGSLTVECEETIISGNFTSLLRQGCFPTEAALLFGGCAQSAFAWVGNCDV